MLRLGQAPYYCMVRVRVRVRVVVREGVRVRIRVRVARVGLELWLLGLV